MERIINSPISSNCFVIYNLRKTNKCIIIDPGMEDVGFLFFFLKKENLFPEFVIITHEHFDHIWGVDKLRDLYPSLSLIAHQIASDAISNPKTNLSLFYNGRGFSISQADILVESDLTLIWNNISIELFSAPGHSPGSLCVFIDNYLFVGDLILKGLAPVVKLPGANIYNLYKSLEYIRTKYSSKNIILKCGHGPDMRVKDIML